MIALLLGLAGALCILAGLALRRREQQLHARAEFVRRSHCGVCGGRLVEYVYVHPDHGRLCEKCFNQVVALHT